MSTETTTTTTLLQDDEEATTELLVVEVVNSQQKQQEDVDNENDESLRGLLCCQFLREGKCTTPRPPCRLRHQVDDGISPCLYGACCRNGHKNRVLGGMTVQQRLEYWRVFNARRGATASAYEHPAERDVTKLQCQLEPWSTAHLRMRLASVFGEDHVKMDSLPRGEIMSLLLRRYETYKQQQRKTVRVLGTPVDSTICDQLLTHLREWSETHKVNSRPSICATSYMILRSPAEFEQQNNDNNNNKKLPSKKARIAAKKLHQFQALWDLATEALATVDPAFAQSFSALAVTKNFQGSPHIDKQNTGPFYGLSLGNFDDGTGGVCVEVDAFTVAHVNTKERLAKVDGRYPHWVAPYTYENLKNANTNNNEEEEEEGYRYSLIYYSTKDSYCPPGPAYFGQEVAVVEE